MRIAHAAIKNVQIEKRAELSDAEVQEVIRRQVKQLQDALVDFTRGNRTDLVDQAKVEIAILSVYLPAQLSDAELESKVKTILDKLGNKAELKPGQVMGVVMKELKGEADGGRGKDFITKILAS